jgi:uncharacterized protein (TIGR02246 family)
MRARIRTGMFVVLAILVSAGFSAASDAEVETTLAGWAAAYAAKDGDRSAGVYAPDARLWGTAARTQSVGRDAIRDYFNNGREGIASRTVTIGAHATRVYGDAAVVSGQYEFVVVRPDGTKAVRPARFSMTFARSGDRWLIVDHHSSVLPDPPKN